MSCGLTLQICLIIASLVWSIALHTQELYIWPHVLKERWHEDRTGSSFLNFFQAVLTCLWLKVHSHLLLRACLLGSKSKLPPPACHIRPGLPSAVCHPRGVQFPGTLYICSQGPLSSAGAHCIIFAPSACSDCRRCCCCPLQCIRRRMETRLNSAGGPGPYCRSLPFLHLHSVLSFPLLLSKSSAS